MVVKVYIKRRAYGMTYAFTIKNSPTLAGKKATLWLWNDRTLRISGGKCTPDSLISTPDTTVNYTVQPDDFPVVEDYDAEIRFTDDSTFVEKSETFLWVVEEAAPSTSTSTTSTSTSTTT